MSKRLTLTLDEKQSASVDEITKLLSGLNPGRRSPSPREIVSGAIASGLSRDLATLRRMSGLMQRNSFLSAPSGRAPAAEFVVPKIPTASQLSESYREFASNLREIARQPHAAQASRPRKKQPQPHAASPRIQKTKHSRRPSSSSSSKR